MTCKKMLLMSGVMAMPSDFPTELPFQQFNNHIIKHASGV